MPNWHTNAIAIHKDNLPLFVNANGEVDFNMLRPMPETLNMPSGSITNAAIAAAESVDEQDYATRTNDDWTKYITTNQRYLSDNLPFPIQTFADLQMLGQIYIDNKEKYGCLTWYEWSYDNWGTKWNASETYIEQNGDIAVLIFETPWCEPQLSMFTDVLEECEHPEFYVEDFDEDFWGFFHWDDDKEEDPCIFYAYEELEDEGTEDEYCYQCEDVNIKWDVLAERMQ